MRISNVKTPEELIAHVMDAAACWLNDTEAGQKAAKTFRENIIQNYPETTLKQWQILKMALLTDIFTKTIERDPELKEQLTELIQAQRSTQAA